MALVHSEGQDRWYFTKEELQRTPSVLAGIDTAKELSYRQQSANLIQDMGQRLLVSQLTINTAIVYMHRFYMFHSFSDMNRNAIAPCCLFLSAKLEEQPRKLEHVIKVANICLQKNDQLDPQSETYLQQAQDLVINESILLQTLGFELTVDHPHTHVVRITQLVRASKDLAQTSYFMATNSLHLTPFCIQHKPSVVACVCIHLACKWSNWEFPRSSDNKDWWEYVDPTVTKQTLDTICQEFLNIIENCPNRLKRRISTVTIYKGGHRSKSAAEKSSKNPTPANGTAGDSKGESSSKADSSSKGEPSGNETLTEADQSQIREQSSAVHTSADQNSEQSNSATLTITSSAAVVETPTSTVILPQLKPLTTKYASMPGLLSNSENQTKSSSSKSSSSNKDNTKIVSGTKHKHREHDESSTPAKKLKTTHSSSSHSSHPKHPSSGRQSFHSKPSKPSSNSAPGSHHKIPKSSSSHPVQSHHNSSPKLPIKSSSSHSHHTHHNSSPKLSVRSSSSHGNSSTHLNHHVKRHSHPGHSTSGHANSHSSGSKSSSSSHKHVSSPLDVKKSSGERHRRPSSSSTKSKPEAPVFGTTSTSRANDFDKTKKSQTMDDFASPPGPQRLQKLPQPPRPTNVAEKTASRHGPPLPSSSQGTPPPPPLPSSLPPPPPPPPT